MIAGFSVLAAHVGGANQYHWIGWYNVAVGGGLLIVLIALFRGECVWKKPEMKCTTIKCSNMKTNKTQALTGSVVNLLHKLNRLLKYKFPSVDVVGGSLRVIIFF